MSRRVYGATNLPHHASGGTSFGAMTGGKLRGIGARLLAMGWVTRHAAAEAMGVTAGELDRAVDAGTIRSRAVAPGVRLYEVAR